MTSKRLFLRGMREDLRHRTWLLALSLIGSFLSMPVLWLLRYSDVSLSNIRFQLVGTASLESAEMVADFINAVAEDFRISLLLFPSVITILGAVIVGLEGFRYLQQKSMVDTYHSLPVSRTQLFGIRYVNGVLLWLVPYLFCMALTLVFYGVLFARLGVTAALPRLIGEAGKNTAVLLVVFMLVYHLMLLSTMLTGNMITTLAVAGILGCGAISVYGLVMGFMNTYFQTCYFQLWGLTTALYISPLAAPIGLLGACMDNSFRVSEGVIPTVLACLGVALALGILAWLAFLKRPSEYAGKGLAQRWIAAPLRLFTAVLGGMGGWLFMYLLVEGNSSRVLWSMFGALFAGILVYGVLDILFCMDFKAFFRHKWSMGAAMVIVLLICFGFYGDWVGYDRYLPRQEEIRSAVIYCRSYSGDSRHSPRLTGAELTDAARIYAFLERGVENSARGFANKPQGMETEEAYRGDGYASDTFYVRVTLDSGRSYYRVLAYYEWDEDVVLPLLCSEEYARTNYYMTEEMIDACSAMIFSSGVDRSVLVEVRDKNILRAVAEAYNQDLLEQPRTVILEEGRQLGQLHVRIPDREDGNVLTLDILEGMTHTLEAMEQNGVSIVRQPTHAGETESITFEINGLDSYQHTGDLSISLAERAIRGSFGVYPESLPALSGTPLEEAFAGGATYSISISDPEEITELLPLLQYSKTGHRVGVFTRGFVGNVSLTDRSGTEWRVCLRRGTLPEKYVRRLIEEVERASGRKVGSGNS